MQPKVPLAAQSLECVGGFVESAIPSLGDGVPEEEGRDGRCWPVDRVGGISGHIEEELRVYLGDLHPEIGGQCLAGDGGPLAERVMCHAPILPFFIRFLPMS